MRVATAHREGVCEFERTRFPHALNVAAISAKNWEVLLGRWGLLVIGVSYVSDFVGAQELPVCMLLVWYSIGYWRATGGSLQAVPVVLVLSVHLLV